MADTTHTLTKDGHPPFELTADIKLTGFKLMGIIVNLKRDPLAAMADMWDAFEQGIEPGHYTEFAAWAETVDASIEELSQWVMQATGAAGNRPTGGQPPSLDGLPVTNTGSMGPGGSEPGIPASEASPL